MNPIYISIFLITFSILIFEISITRLFSIYLSYHFAFMVVSIAMLGIGSAGTILSLRTEKPVEHIKKRLSTYALLTGIAIITSYITSNHIPFDPVKLSWDKMQIFYFSLYCSVFSIPFFFLGLLIATAFYLLSRNAESIYASDLLGAGAGSLTTVLLLNTVSPEYAVISASIICLLSSIIIGDNRQRSLSLIFILINLSFLILHPEFIDIRISPYKNLSVALKYPDSQHIKTYNHSIARIDTLKSPMIRFAPGMSLKYTGPLPEQIGIAVDGGELYAVTGVDDERALRFLDYLPSAVAYREGKRERALIVDPKGGLHVLIARRYKVKELHKVESNPLLIRVIRNDLGDFSGRIFEHNTWEGAGRNFLQRTNAISSYDIIDISMTGATVSSFFGIMEDYRYTVEAFMEYLRGLKDNGILSISMYLIPPPRKEFRILTTAITALEKTGIKEIGRNIVAIRSWDTMTILIRKIPFTHREIEDIKGYIKENGFDFVYYPGIREEDTGVYIKTSDNEYFRGFKSIIDTEERRQFIADYPFDIRPVHDENPFFHYYLKIRNIREIYNLMGKKWLYFIEEGYITPLVFIITLLLSMLMILLPLSFKIRFKRFKPFKLLPTILYFSMLGLGYMFIEVTLIQKHILILENPVYSLSLVLTTVLIASGTGSMLSSRFNGLRKSSILPLLSFLILIYSLIQPSLFKAILPYPFTMKIFIILLTIIPPGLLMGIPFPLGIKLIGQRDASLIPWAWATNAFLSVIAPVITIMIATVIGFKGMLWLASLAYLIAFAGLRRF